MPNTYVDKVVAVFRKSVAESYELEDEVVISLALLVRKALEKVTPPTARRTRSKQKQRRKKSAYNMFVREMMKDEVIRALGHKNKMAAIGSRWTTLEDDDKEPYKSMANDENASDEAAATALAEEAEAEAPVDDVAEDAVEEDTTAE
jgi:hypothetical protein